MGLDILNVMTFGVQRGERLKSIETILDGTTEKNGDYRWYSASVNGKPWPEGGHPAKFSLKRTSEGFELSETRPGIYTKIFSFDSWGDLNSSSIKLTAKAKRDYPSTSEHPPVGAADVALGDIIRTIESSKITKTASLNVSFASGKK